jgi:hypothetical protein
MIDKHLRVLRPQQSRIRGGQAAWLLIMALALALRVGGINRGLPYLFHPDEPALIGPAIRIIQTGGAFAKIIIRQVLP